ncbi:exonuclease RecJ [Thermodesulfitimonas autotrophica]|uniref:Single-stranded-DNA-specific exonuclease RecJ n=1 Tax=Thermodesulfitimonas autotrophica TaxID=1894989 RepID=A0A3N5AY17_9THEO|nr:single-stranded-DNA-specific exonuclease RecJ [Thermodesulfitimonas autotrophica]RPF49857.1 exonuclease RecJ [Thermodesulfitimonas autotrophica]
MAGSKWRVAPEEPLLRALFVRELGLHPVTAQCLINRGVWSLREAAAFLAGEPAQLASPWHLKDLDKAVARLKRAVAERERVLIYGDYDADGMTATALLFLALRELGLEADCYLPSREAGYGLKEEMLRRFREEGVRLVVTADCGISALREAALCRELGIDLVVTDHHQPGPALPDAVAVVNPKRADCPYPYKELAGVGVAYQVAAGLFESFGAQRARAAAFLDLVAIGTIADVVPLTGENRILVRAGLKELNERPRPGLQVLLQAAGATGRVTARTVAMVLAPRLNAPGRVGDPRPAFELLLCGEEEAQEKAAWLDRLNQERQRLEALMTAEAQALVDGRPGAADQAVIVVAGEGWLPGLTGIVANRLVERYGRPVFVIALNGEEGRGSGRGVPGFNVFGALAWAGEQLIDYGGHAGAGGFTIHRQAVEPFRRAVEEYARRAEPVVPESAACDVLVRFTDLTPELVTELALLEPHGCANPPVRLVACGVSVEEARPVGSNGNHLKLRLRQDNVSLEGIGYGLASAEELPAVVDLVFRPILSEVTGRLELKVEEFCRAGGTAQDDREEPDRAGILIRKASRYISGLTDLYLPEPLPEKVLAGERSGALIDLRDSPGRWRALAQMLTTPAAVVVSTPAVASEVTARLRLLFPERARRIMPFHGGLAAERRTIAALAAAGEVDILVTTPALAGRFNADRDVFVFDLMYLWPHWEWLRSCGGRNLILLYGRQDREATRRRLGALAPPRRVLFAFYRHLLHQAGRGVIRFSLAEAAAFLRSLGIPGAGRRAVENLLVVLSELELVRFTMRNGGCSVWLQKPPRRRFLPAAPTFRNQHNLKREVLCCQQHFLTAPAEILKDYFRCGIITRGGSNDFLRRASWPGQGLQP